jgi:integrase/recombinase XerD
MYQYYLDTFLNWANKDAESLLFLGQSDLDTLLQDYLFHLKKTLSPNSIGPRLAAIGKFLIVNDKTFNSKKLKLLMPEKVKIQGGTAWQTGDLAKMIEFADTAKSKALIHVLAASGCRPGGLVSLKFKDVSDMPEGCKALVFYAGSKWEYVGFIHHEAAKALDEYIEKRQTDGEMLRQESFVFSSPSSLLTKPRSLTEKDIYAIVLNVVNKAGLKRTKQGHRYNIPIITGIRKRFNTILKSNPNVSYAIAERLFDHRTNLEAHYLDTPREKLFEEYKKAIQQLTIDEKERLRIENQKKDQELKQAQDKDKLLSEMQDRLSELEAKLKRQHI